MEVIVTTIEEEFQKARTKGAKDKAPRKRKLQQLQKLQRDIEGYYYEAREMGSGTKSRAKNMAKIRKLRSQAYKLAKELGFVTKEED
jgi:hypothetical protein